GIDLIHPPFWYWAMYTGLLATGVSHPWLFPALIVILVGYVVGRVTEGIFMRRFGFHIHVWRPVDAFVREITARRNPNLLIFTISSAPGFAKRLFARAGDSIQSLPTQKSPSDAMPAAPIFFQVRLCH
ncbi:MAG: hypothetical protein AAFQ12_11500, partial [Pseudomonadota bacterium]